MRADFVRLSAMSKDPKESALDGGTYAPWQREFFKNIGIFMQSGMKEEKAREMLIRYLKLSVETPIPRVIETFSDFLEILSISSI